jgi:RNA polymerase sigma-70 factor, ECF subfamily
MALSEEQERELITRITAGEKDLYATLVDEHKRRIFQFIWRHVKNESIAAELTQECFVKGYYSLSRFRAECRFIYWLERIAINSIKSFTSSKRGKEMKLWESLDQVGTLSTNNISPEEDAINKELLVKVRNELSKMSLKFAQVIQLCVLNDKPTASVAKILNIPEGTVLSRLNRGLRELVKRLGDKL